MMTLTNLGNNSLTITGVALGGANQSNFSTTNTCVGSSLSPGSHCSISVTFTPALSTTYTAILTLADNTGTIAGSTITGSGAAQAGCQNIGVPMYVLPVENSDDWTTALSSIPIPTGKQLILIMNPASGPGTQGGPEFLRYQKDVAAAHTNGIKIYGYVSTQDKTGNNISPDVIHTQVMDYISWFNVNGIFLDQVVGDAAHLAYYTGLVSDITTSLPGGGVWLNPGVYPDERFMNIPVPPSSQLLVNVFENTYAIYLNPVDPPAWITNYAGDRITHLVHTTNATDLTTALKLSIQRNAGWVYFTERDPNVEDPWARLSKYWTTDLVPRTRSACNP